MRLPKVLLFIETRCPGGWINLSTRLTYVPNLTHTHLLSNFVGHSEATRLIFQGTWKMITERRGICFHFEGAPHAVREIGINLGVLRLESELVV